MTTSATAALDAALFTPDGWFAIDAGNQRVPGVVVPDLATGLALAGRGRVATIVGRLVAQLRVVDVDLTGVQADAAVELLVSWSREHGLWSLVRPSGGAPGRAHVFVATNGRHDELAAHVTQIRAKLRAPAKGVDLRTTVRPLSAPHRHGVRTQPHGRPSDALTTLRRQLRHGAARQQQPKQAAQPSPGALVPLVPRPRGRRPLQGPWAAYLATGTVPSIGGTDRSRSTIEAIATNELLRAGHDHNSAWQQIQNSHPVAMTRAKADQRRWTAWVWNRAVRDDNAYQRPVRDDDEELQAALGHARAQLERAAWAEAPRRRRTLLLVGHTILDRIARTGDRRIPVPERDLHEDTGLDRSTVRAVLRRLHGQLGVLHTDLLDRSPAARASTSYEFEIPGAPQGVRQIPPPSSHTPAPPGTWSLLPGPAHQLWRALQNLDRPVRTPDLARIAQMTPDSQTLPTTSQIRAARAALLAMARAGLATCDEAGQWSGAATVTADHVEAAAARRAELARAVAAERAAYRAGSTSAWSIARAAALKANRAREQAWWDGLEPAERARRRAQWRHRFEGLAIVDQEAIKAALADRRGRAGVDEAARHDAWINAWPDETYARRVLERQAAFASLPRPLQHAHVAAWQRHRDRYGIPRGSTGAATRQLHNGVLPSSGAARDDRFLGEQLPLTTMEEMRHVG